jgi:hypothetical protein
VRADGTGRLGVSLAPGRLRRPTEYAWSRPSGSRTSVSGLAQSASPTGRPADRQYHVRRRRTSWSLTDRRSRLRAQARLCAREPDGTNLEASSDSDSGSRVARLVSRRTSLLTGRTVVYSLDVDDGELRELVDMGGETNVVIRARWAPDGRAVLIRRFPSVYVARLDGSAPTKLVDGDLGDWGTSPALTVTNARFEPRWVLSRQTGRLRLSGTASHASNVSVVVRGRAEPIVRVRLRPPAVRGVDVLPRDLLPDRSRSWSGDRRPNRSSPSSARDLPAPRWASSRARGSASGGEAAPGPHRTTLFAQFAFSVPAAGQRLRVCGRALRATRMSVGALGSCRRASRATSACSAVVGCRLEARRTPLAIASVRVGWLLPHLRHPVVRRGRARRPEPRVHGIQAALTLRSRSAR